MTPERLMHPSPLISPPAPRTGWQNGFWWLMATQFQNAFSDNALKKLIVLLVLSRSLSTGERDTYVALAGGLFALPFIFLGMLGGWLADRFPKRSVMRGVKSAEVAIMTIATVALWMEQLTLQLIAVFLMGCHSAIFGPSKYGILPETLPPEKLSWGNGILELLTFLGIIFGSVCGALFAAWFKTGPAPAGLLLLGIACAGWWMSLGIPPLPAANPGCALRINPVTTFWLEMREMRADRDLWRANLGNAAFFFIAALVQMNLILFANDVLHLNEAQNGFLDASLAIGIGVGSVAAGYASHGVIEYRLIPAGALLMFLSTLAMGRESVGVATFTCALIVLGLGGGLYIVPLTAVLQSRPAPEKKGAVQGAASTLSFLGILFASGFQRLLRLWLSAGQVFWACGVAALAIGLYVSWSRGLYFFSKERRL